MRELEQNANRSLVSLTGQGRGAYRHQSRHATHHPRHFAGLSIALLAGQFITITVLAASMAPGYDVATTAISDLGIIPATSAPNILGAVALLVDERRRLPLVRGPKAHALTAWMDPGTGPLEVKSTFRLPTRWPANTVCALMLRCG